MLEFSSPAKINLTFKVLAKRADGYHEIESVYQAIDLFDRLFFSFAPVDLITCDDPTIPTDSKNLIHKALSAFREKYLIDPVHIHLEKRIPVEAGLGGGSSNAATTLKGLNTLLNQVASQEELIEIAKTIGSDVPFFFSNGCALCRGRGEILAPYTLEKPIHGWIAKPSYGLSTPLVYKHTQIEKLAPREPHFHFYNDLEVAAFELEPRLIPLKDELKKSFQSVTMTGSGTAFFCLEGTPQMIDDVRYFPFNSLVDFSRSW